MASPSPMPAPAGGVPEPLEWLEQRHHPAASDTPRPAVDHVQSDKTGSALPSTWTREPGARRASTAPQVRDHPVQQPGVHPHRGQVAGLAEGHRVALDLPDDLPAVRVDAGLLDRVVANLVDNALRHTGSLVQVLGEADPDLVRLHVVDHGPGCPRPARVSILEPFQRLGDAPAGEGVGLGLAVARGLTEAMGGTVTASDTPGGGS